MPEEKGGFGLLEVIVGISLLLVVFFSLLSLSRLLLLSTREAGKNLQAGFLLSEGVEAARFVRDESYSLLIPGASSYLSPPPAIWSVTTTPEVIDGTFYRTFSVSNVYRDINDDISDVGTLDPNTKKIQVSVSWLGRNGATTTQSVSAYLTKYF